MLTSKLSFVELNLSVRVLLFMRVSTWSYVVGTASRQLRSFTGCFADNVSSRVSVPLSMRQTTSLVSPTSTSLPEGEPNKAQRFQVAFKDWLSGDGSIKSAPSVATIVRPSSNSTKAVSAGYTCSTGAENPVRP